MRRNGLPDRIIAAVDQHQLLSEAQARTAEHLAARPVAERPDLTLLNHGLLAGDRLVSGPCMATHRFVAAFFERVEQARLLNPVASAQGPLEAASPARPRGQGHELHAGAMVWLHRLP